MGQHKHNPVAIAAKKGEIEPIKRVSKAQQISSMKAALNMALYKKGLLPTQIFPYMYDYSKEDRND